MRNESDQISLIGDSGCMLGSIVSGAVDFMRNSGLKRVDVVAGASASAGTFAYYASGQFDKGKHIWTQGLVENHDFLLPWAVPEFLSRQVVSALRRMPCMQALIDNPDAKRPILDIDYLVREIFQRYIPLDAQALRNSPIRLIVPVTDARTHEAAFFTNHDPIDIFELLKATMCVPWLYRPSYPLDGRPYYDGAFSAPLPIDHPELANTQMIVLLTSPVKHILETMSFKNRTIRAILRPTLNPTLGDAFDKGAEERFEAFTRLLEMQKNDQVIVIAPEEGYGQFDTGRVNVAAMTEAGKMAASSNAALRNLIDRRKKEGNPFYTTDDPVPGEQEQ